MGLSCAVFAYNFNMDMFTATGGTGYFCQPMGEPSQADEGVAHRRVKSVKATRIRKKIIIQPTSPTDMPRKRRSNKRKRKSVINIQRTTHSKRRKRTTGPRKGTKSVKRTRRRRRQKRVENF